MNANQNTTEMSDDDILNNPLLNTDSYKLVHNVMYNEFKVQAGYSYIEPRIHNKELIVIGMQMYLKRMKRITHQMVDQAKQFFANHIVDGDQLFPEKQWRMIVDKYDGIPPLTIRAVPEGTIVQSNNVIVTVQCDVPELTWVGPYYETQLLRALWYPTTVATKSWEIRNLLRHYIDVTSDINVEDGVKFIYHDFGARGTSSHESAAIGGCAHILAGSSGSDTVIGTSFANKYYNSKMSAFSVAATEHSIMTINGRQGELETVRACINRLNTSKNVIVSLVSDGYDIFNLVDQYCTTLKQEIIDSKISLVIRPDSGDPATVIIQLLNKIEQSYGVTINSKGFKVLNNRIKILQGDGLSTIKDFDVICKKLIANQYSIENIVFGQGGGLLQQVGRDDLKFAMKLSAVKIDGQWRDVFKDPITDIGKVSKKGRVELFVNVNTGEQKSLNIDQPIPQDWKPMMIDVFKNQTVLINDTVEQIQQRTITRN